MAKKTNGYVEPKDYFPKEVRKKYGLGEYANQTKKTVKKTIKKK